MLNYCYLNGRTPPRIFLGASVVVEGVSDSWLSSYTSSPSLTTSSTGSSVGFGVVDVVYQYKI